MKNSKKTKKAMAFGAAIAMAASCVGVAAFFTDRDSATASATAGNIDLVFTDTSANEYSYDKGDGEIGNNQGSQDKVWEKKALVSGDNIINPGDAFDMSYNLSNAGSKSIDVDQKIVLTSDKPMTADLHEYALTITGGKDTQVITPELSDNGKVATYEFNYITLDGKADAAGREEETNERAIGEDNATYTVKLDFQKEAKNAFMDSKVTIDLYAQAKQHRNTDAGEAGVSADWADEWVTMAGVEQTGAKHTAVTP